MSAEDDRAVSYSFVLTSSPVADSVPCRGQDLGSAVLEAALPRH